MNPPPVTKSLALQLVGPPPDPQATAAVPVIVTSAFEKASPLKVPRVRVMAAPARMFPTKFESVIVTAWATHQVTLQGCAPPAMTTTKLVPVSAPVAGVPDPTLKTQLAVGGPSSVRRPVSTAAAGKQ